MTVQIDKDIPLPRRVPRQRYKTGDKYAKALDALEVGHSFIMPDFQDKALASRLLGARARNFAIYTYRRVGESDNARVWRVS